MRERFEGGIHVEFMNGAIDPLVAMLLCFLGAIGVLWWNRERD